MAMGYEDNAKSLDTNAVNLPHRPQRGAIAGPLRSGGEHSTQPTALEAAKLLDEAVTVLGGNDIEMSNLLDYLRGPHPQEVTNGSNIKEPYGALDALVRTARLILSFAEKQRRLINEANTLLR